MTNPWEMNREMPAQDVVVEQPKAKGVMPWLMDRMDMGANKAPTPMKQQVPDMFDRVFANLIQAESAGKHTNKAGQLTTSPVGAKGITQVMPATGKDPGYGVKPLADDSQAEYERFGGDYLRAMLTNFNGDYAKAVAAYNAGAGSVRNAITKATKAGDPSDWMNHLPKKSETIPYVKKILRGLQ